MTRPQEVRHEVLLQLYGSQSIAVSADHIRKVAKRGGFDYTCQEILDQLAFMLDQQFCTVVLDNITGERRYRITAKGSLEYENQG